jgi:hypothetical protein
LHDGACEVDKHTLLAHSPLEFRTIAACDLPLVSLLLSKLMIGLSSSSHQMFTSNKALSIPAT